MNIGGAPWPISFGIHDESSTDNVYDKNKKVRRLNSITLNPGDGIIVYSGETISSLERPTNRGPLCSSIFTLCRSG